MKEETVNIYLLKYQKIEEAIMISGEGWMAEVLASLLARKFNNEGGMESRLKWTSSMSQPESDALIRRSDESTATHHVSMLYGRAVARLNDGPRPRCNGSMTYCIENNFTLSTSNSGVTVSVQLSHIGTGYSLCCISSISRIDDYSIRHHFDIAVTRIQSFPSHSANSGLASVLSSDLALSYRSSLAAYTSEASGNSTTASVLMCCINKYY